MQKSLYLNLLLALMLGITGCQSSSTSEEMDVSTPELISSSPAPIQKAAEAEEVAPQIIPQPKVVREATIRFQVKNLDRSTQRIDSLVDINNAQIASSRNYNGDGSLEAEYTIRVAPEKLYTLVRAIQSESIYLDTKTVTADDVTRKYIDLEARIRTKQAVEQRYLDLLKQAGNIKDILAIEAELTKIREDLESAQAQLKGLQQLTRYSTIHLSMYQFVPTSYTGRTTFFTRTVSALEAGWSLFKSFLIAILYIWPIWVFFPLGLWLYKKLKKLQQEPIL